LKTLVWAAASALLVQMSLYLDALCAGLLQQFDGACVRCLLAPAIVPGQVAASGATRQLVAQLLSRHRVLQGGTAKTEAGRRCEERKTDDEVRKQKDLNYTSNCLCLRVFIKSTTNK